MSPLQFLETRQQKLVSGLLETEALLTRGWAVRGAVPQVNFGNLLTPLGSQSCLVWLCPYDSLREQSTGMGAQEPRG